MRFAHTPSKFIFFASAPPSFFPVSLLLLLSGCSNHESKKASIEKNSTQDHLLKQSQNLKVAPDNKSSRKFVAEHNIVYAPFKKYALLRGSS